MILSSEKKVIMLFVPRTGTNTLRTMFKNTGIPLTVCDESHTGYANLAEVISMDQYSIEDKFGIPNLEALAEYKIYSFCRDPFDRCISIVNYLRRGKQCSKFFHAFYGDEFPISCSYRKPYAEWTDEMRQMCDSVPMIEVFRKFKWYMERGVYGKTHKRWLEGNVIPLRFEDYDNEVSKVLIELGVDPSTVTIPHINPSTTIPEYDALSPLEEAEIREYMREDYEFLASKGVIY